MKTKNAINAGSVNASPLGNHAPIGNGNTTFFRGAHAGHPYTVTAIDLLAGYTDPDGDTLSVIDLQAQHATITDNLDGTYLITPEVGYIGLVALSYTISDGRGGTLDTGNGVYFLPDATAPPIVRVNTGIEGFQMSPDIAVFSDGSYVITWVSDSSGDYPGGVYVQRYNAEGLARGTEIHVTSDEPYIDLFNGGGASVTALTDGRFVVTWEDRSNVDNSSTVYLQTYNSDGEAAGDRVQVSSDGVGENVASQITTLHDGGFLVTWAAEGDIVMQRFDSDGGKDGDPTFVNTVTDGNETYARVAAFDDGGWIVVWQGVEMSDPNSSDVFAQRFGADGHMVGEETVINTVTDGAQGLPSVATLANGDYVVTWSGTTLENSEVYLQRYSADGQKLGEETMVNTTTVAAQMFSKVAALSDGGYVVSWLSWSQTFDFYFDVNIQQYDAEGRPVGEETLISSPFGISLFQEIAALPDGQYLTAWMGYAFDENLNPITEDFDILKSVNAPQRVPVLAGAQAVLSHATEDTAYIVSAADLLRGVVDLNGDTLEITAISANHGSVADNHDGTFTVTPAANFRGVTTLTYTISDGHGNTLDVDNDLTVDGVIDTIFSSRTANLGSYLENLTLTGGNDIDGTGNALDNAIFGNRGANLLLGHDGNDTLNGGNGNDSLYGGAGDDVYIVSNPGDLVSEEGAPGVDAGGTDTVYAGVNWTLGGLFENLVLAGTDNLSGFGNDLDNQIRGNVGNNVLDGGAGADTLSGGGGDDTYYIDDADDRAQEAPDKGMDSIESSVNWTLRANFESLVLTGAGNLTGNGNDLDNLIIGNTGNNILNGRAGADTLSGGTGNDSYYVDDTHDSVAEASDAGTDTVYASMTWTLGDFLENLTLTGTSSIGGTGNALDNVLVGNSGNNELDGGAGADLMIGGTGSDFYRIDDIADRVREYADGGTDTVEALVSVKLAANVENLNMAGSDNLQGIGNDGVNYMVGNNGNNLLNGMAGADTMYGLAGNDTYYVDNANDIASEQGNLEPDDGGTDTVISTVDWTLIVNFENLTLFGSDNIGGTGNSLDNALRGNSGANRLSGLDGADKLFGGDGADTFVFLAAGANGFDRVYDFASGIDHLAFSGADYGFATGHGLEGTELTVGRAAIGQNAQFIFNANNHTLYWDADGSGAVGAVALAVLTGVTVLQAGDFLFE